MTSGGDGDASRFSAARPISSTASSMKTKMPAAASVSNLRWPYGWSASGGLRAARSPTRPMTLEAESVSEWKPSETMLTAPVA